MFIVIYQLAQGPVNREELRRSSQRVAQRISRLYGINAPEFSDQRLFDQFIDDLRNRGILYAVEACVEEPENEMLTYDPIVTKVLRAAAVVIDPQIRHGVLAESNHR
jgi:glycerol-3-phosphate O-acyltransferase